MARRFVLLLAGVVATSMLAGAPAASAHQTLTKRGVTVTMHVNPDDAPVAGSQSLIEVLGVRPRRGRFSWRTCRCKLAIVNAEGRRVARGRAGKRSLVTFPTAGAYQLTLSGRYRQGKRWRPFAVTFALRAS